MNNFYLAFSVVFPLFCMMALGYGLRLCGVFNEPFLAQLNRLCFQVFLPLVLFVNIYSSDFKQAFRPGLVLYAAGAVVAAFLLLMALVPLLTKQNADRGVLVQGIFRSNFILFGLPITASLYGGENVAVTVLLLAIVVPLFNALSVVALEVFSGQKKGVGGILKGVAKNPLILASLCAFALLLAGVRLPGLVVSTLTDISKVATPLALIVLGGGFRFGNLRRYAGLLSMGVVGKLVVLPAVFVPLAVLLGFRGMELTALFAMLASPTAVSTYTMAQSAKANHELAGQIVVLDSLFSVLTIFIGIVLLRQLGLV